MSQQIQSPILTERFDFALGYFSRLHRNQTRKNRAIPYVSHLLRVAGYVLEFGGNEDEAIAALGHDAIEDQGESWGSLTATFGSNVADIVLGCSDATETKPAGREAWQERKEQHIAHLSNTNTNWSVPFVSCCDKFDNLSTIRVDMRTAPLGKRLDVFDRFIGGLDGSLWYYKAMANAFGGNLWRMPARHKKRFRPLLTLFDNLVEDVSFEVRSLQAVYADQATPDEENSDANTGGHLAGSEPDQTIRS